MRPEIKEIAIDKNFRSAELPCKIADFLNITPRYCSKNELIEEIKSRPTEDRFKMAKKTLFFTENRGKFLKKCPGSRGVVCCDYYTVNSVTGCPFDCNYCILQHYIENNPFITIFLNRKKAIEEISEFLNKFNWLRVGTGELADSLALDRLLDETGFFAGEIDRLGLFDKVQFEFKTKSAETERLLDVKKQYKNANIVVGFSLNIPKFQEAEEAGTASIEERLQAAERLQLAGIDIAIHFDPILMLDELLDDYKLLINSVFSRLDGKKIAWISMGGFRHALALAEIIQKRNPDSLLLQGEMFPSDIDNKLRYLAPVRRKFYKLFYAEISPYFKGNPPLYLCMEKAFIWSDLKMPPLKKLFPS